MNASADSCVCICLSELFDRSPESFVSTTCLVTSPILTDARRSAACGSQIIV